MAIQIQCKWMNKVAELVSNIRDVVERLLNLIDLFLIVEKLLFVCDINDESYVCSSIMYPTNNAIMITCALP